jgi:thiol-disulfide isomerase/thioredoxin
MTYPALAKAGSPFNRKFIALFNEVRASDPDFLTRPNWPLLLAERTAKELGGGVMPVVAAGQHSQRPAFWTDNYAGAMETARAENKNVLLDFTGSDWCQYCMALDREVLNTPRFKAWAAEHVVLVKVDFPDSLPQSGTVKAQNAQLKRQYPFDGYPTILIVDPSGKVLCRKYGYTPGRGPDAYIASLESSIRK